MWEQAHTTDDRQGAGQCYHDTSSRYVERQLAVLELQYAGLAMRFSNGLETASGSSCLSRCTLVWRTFGSGQFDARNDVADFQCRQKGKHWFRSL